MAELEHRPEGENLDPAANLLGQKREMPDQMTTTPLMDQVLGDKDKGPEWTPEKVDQLEGDIEQHNESLRNSPKVLDGDSSKEEADRFWQVEDARDKVLKQMPGETHDERVEQYSTLQDNLDKIDQEFPPKESEEPKDQEQAA